MVWDPGSGKANPDPGSRGQKGTRSRLRIRNTVLLVCFGIRPDAAGQLDQKIIQLSHPIHTGGQLVPGQVSARTEW
jgi:hypothetical protein